MMFYVCMQVNIIESIVCWFWVSMWETFCRDTNVRFWSGIGAVPESKEDQEVSSIPPPALSPLIAVRERTHTDTNPRQGHSSMVAKIISRMQSVWVFRGPLVHLLCTRYYSKFWTTARGRHCFTGVCKWEGSHRKPQVAKSRDGVWVQATAQPTPTPDTDEHLPCWATVRIQSTPSSFCILQKDTLQHSRKEFSQSVILRHPYQGVFTRFLNPVFKHQGKNLSMKTWDIGNIE